MAGILDVLFGAPEEDQLAEEYLKKSANAYDGIIPQDLAPVDFEEYQYQGDLMPGQLVNTPDVHAERVDASTINPALVEGSSFDGISTDPRLRDSQMASLSALQEIANNGGFSAKEQADLARVQNEVAAADRGRRDAILQNMRARGMGGSGSELLAQLQSSQAATDRAAQAGLDINAQAQQRALQALQQAGTQAGQMRGQEFGEKSQIAQAQDAIRQFNAQHRQAANQFNAGARMQTGQFNASTGLDAQKANAGYGLDAGKFNAGTVNDAGTRSWTARQGISDANTELGNKQKTINQIDLPTQQLQNQLGVASGVSNANKTGTDYWSKAGDRKSKIKGGIWEAGVKAGSAAVASDEDVKKDIGGLSPEEIDSFLKAVKPKKFKYKNPSDPMQLPGERVGFIAQDVKDAGAGKTLIKSEGEMLSYDPVNLQGIMLAALKHVSEDVESLKDKDDDKSV